jgi:hypothetical protein
VCVCVYIYIKSCNIKLNNEIVIYISVYIVSNVRIISELERKGMETSMAQFEVLSILQSVLRE